MISEFDVSPGYNDITGHLPVSDKINVSLKRALLSINPDVAK